MLTSCDSNNESKINQLLSEYWQPFAVTPGLMDITIWFRKFEGRRVRRVHDS